MHHPLNADMKACIEECLRCHSICLGMASHHCLEQGGKHVEPTHFRLMLACAEICSSAANMMLIGSEQHKRVCGVCADLCQSCAQSCERLEGMEDCVEACRRCEQHCRKMSS